MPVQRPKRVQTARSPRFPKQHRPRTRRHSPDPNAHQAQNSIEERHARRDEQRRTELEHDFVQDVELGEWELSCGDGVHGGAPDDAVVDQVGNEVVRERVLRKSADQPCRAIVQGPVVWWQPQPGAVPELVLEASHREVQLQCFGHDGLGWLFGRLIGFTEVPDDLFTDSFYTSGAESKIEGTEGEEYTGQRFEEKYQNTVGDKGKYRWGSLMN